MFVTPRFSDRGTGKPNGFKTSGVSLNLDYLPADNLMWRIEARGFKSRDKIFESDEGYRDVDFFITTSLALKIN